MKTMIAGISLLLVVGSVHAFPRGEHLSEEERTELREKRFVRLSEKLALTDDQKIEVKAILDQAHAQRSALRDERRAERNAMKNEVRAQLATVLSDTQLAELDALREQRRARKHARD